MKNAIVEMKAARNASSHFNLIFFISFILVALRFFFIFNFAFVLQSRVWFFALGSWLSAHGRRNRISLATALIITHYGYCFFLLFAICFAILVRFTMAIASWPLIYIYIYMWCVYAHLSLAHCLWVLGAAGCRWALLWRPPVDELSRILLTRK